MRTRLLAYSAATAALILGGPCGATIANAEDGDIPVLGQVATRPADGNPDQELIVSVHGVRRAYGATIVYWSAGFRKDATGLVATSALHGFGTDHALGRGQFTDPVGNVAVTDPVGLKVYGPLTVDNMPVSSNSYQALDTEAGQVRAYYAALPELPTTVETVDVHAGGVDFLSVPVEDGPLLPERSADWGVDIGSGWPKPDTDKIAQDKTPQQSVYPMQQNIANLESSVTERKSSERASVDLTSDVLFAVDQATVSANGRAAIEQAAASLKNAGAEGAVEVSGHTDSDGEQDYNQDLSQRRAEAVLAELKPLVPNTITLTAVGHGETQPIATNDTDSGKQANRRVSLVYNAKAGN